MNFITIVSLILFIAFITSYIMKLIILHKKYKVNGNVLAKGKKEKNIKSIETLVKTATFLWGLIWFVESVFEKYMLKYFPYILNSLLVRYIGLILLFIGVLIFTIAAFSMRSSWRVGIDKNTKTKLVTYGIYKFSRNPAFVGFNTMFIGLFVTFPNILTFIILILNIISIHLLILQEEHHLSLTFGDDYKEYKKNTPRYL